MSKLGEAPSRSIDTFKDACLLANFNVLSPFFMFKVYSCFVNVYRATPLSQSGLSINFAAAWKTGF